MCPTAGRLRPLPIRAHRAEIEAVGTSPKRPAEPGTGARIDRLPPEEKRLLQTAAVIGTEVPLPLLQAIAERPEATLHRSLAHMQAAEFLYETSTAFRKSFIS